MKTMKDLAKRAAMLLMTIVYVTISMADDNDLYRQQHDFVVDGIFYRYNTDGQSVSVTYQHSAVGNWSFVTLVTPYFGDVVIPKDVTYNNVVYPVTGIDQYTFQCSYNDGGKITSVSIPNTVTNIGRYAFSCCRELKELSIPNSVETIGEGAFTRCESITELVIPNSVTSVSAYLCNGCEKLTSITLPSGITSIGDNAFYQCFELESISFPNSTAGSGQLRIPEGVTSIGNQTFEQCRKLQSVTIPASVTRIGNGAFSGTDISFAEIRCTNLAEMENGEFLNIGKNIFTPYNYEHELSVYLPDYYSALAICLNNSLGNYYGIHLYADGTLITDYTLPENVWAIPAESFQRVVDMKTITLPSKLQAIETNAFANCTGLEEVICTNADALTTIQEKAFTGCSNLKEFKFGKNIKTIGRWAFSNCTNLMKVDIGDLSNWCGVDFQGSFSEYLKGVESNPLCYAKRIYLNDKELNNLAIPSDVQIIKKYAFAGVHRFEKLTIPKSVTTIEDYAFAYCEDMNNIVFRSTTNLTTLGNGVFYGCIGLNDVTLPNSITSLGISTFYCCI